MSEQGSADHIAGSVSGPVSGQVAIGKDIRQSQTVGSVGEATDAELAELQQAFEDLKEQVLAAAPAASQSPALERLQELEEAVIAEEPDVTTMEYVKRWFARNLPRVAGSVASVLVHPVVGKLARSAGEAVTDEYMRTVGGR